MSKRIAAIALAVGFISLAIAPDTNAQRFRRDCDRSGSSRSYRSYSNGVSAQRYYASPYYNTRAPRYYRPSNGVAGQRYYASPYYNNGTNRYYGESYYRDNNHSTRNAVLTVVGPAAVGAGIGAITSGKKGAIVGALIGGGGGAVYHLLKNRGRRY